MIFKTHSLNKAKLRLLFVAIFCMSLTTQVYAQDNNYIKLADSTVLNPDNCLDRTSNFSRLKLLKTQTNKSLTNLEILTKTSTAEKRFNSIEAFNTFDLKFWLLDNAGFIDQDTINIRIDYQADDKTIQQLFSVCFIYEISTSEDFRGDSNDPDYAKLSVFFGTDRNYTSSSDLNSAFGVKRAKISYGIVEVSIPHDHRIGEIESPSIWRFEFTEDPSKHIMLQDIKLLNKAVFFKSLASEIAKTDKKRSFLFVHGYNTSFEEAAKRTAQISYDLKFDGKAVFYSWPSQASVFKYDVDEANIAWSRKNIKNFLTDYLSKCEAEEIYLVAHSMGNRGLTRAIVEVMEAHPELRTKIKEIILAAPDIDADVFKNEIAPQMVTGTKKPITLYVSSDDLALKASRLLHGKPRAGDAGDTMVILNGVETIDATGIDTSFLSHSYFADTNSIISDIFDLIESGKRALNRKQLLEVRLSNNTYFKVKQ